MTSTWRNETLTLDERLALKTAAGHLARQFDGTFGRETIERFLHSSYDEFAQRAVVLNFLPLLAEKFARQRLHALAKVEGKARDGDPVVLFLCTHNAGRSQMALGFFQHIAGDTATAWSGGSEPATTVNPAAIAAMAERGIDISTEYPKPGPARSSGPPTSWSPWDAGMPVPSFRVDAMRSGSSTTRPGWTSSTSALSGTRSNAECGHCSRSSSPAPRPEQEAEMVWTIFGRPVRRDPCTHRTHRRRRRRPRPGNRIGRGGRMAGTGTRSRGAADGAADATSRSRPPHRSVGVQPASRSGVRRSAGAPSSSPPHGRPAPATAHRGGPQLGRPTSSRGPVDAAVPRRDEQPGAISPRGRPS